MRREGKGTWQVGEELKKRRRNSQRKGRFCIHAGGGGSLPTVGVLPALSEAFEDKEEELSARASGAAGGGLALDVLGGLNGRT